jgi:uncharacterized protein
MKRMAMFFAALMLIGLGLLAVAGPSRMLARFTTPAELYQGHAFVTGQRDETRIPGFERALVDVVKKITGDFGISPADVMKSIGGPVQDYVTAYHETDRMPDIPIHDEQGTRDRPFDLIVTFKPKDVHALVKRLGGEPWLGSRPHLLVLLNVTTDAGTYLLTEDADQGSDQREALQAAAWTAGLPIILPTQGQRDARASPAQMATDAKPDYILEGVIIWTKGMKGWEARWDLKLLDGPKEWQIKNVNFDEAFRNALQGAASILSGHGVIADRGS